MFNDLPLKMGFIWGMAIIDTVKETVYLSNLSKEDIKELETVLSKYMIQKKRQLEMGDESELKNVKRMEKELVNISKNGDD